MLFPSVLTGVLLGIFLKTKNSFILTELVLQHDHLRLYPMSPYPLTSASDVSYSPHPDSLFHAYADGHSGTIETERFLSQTLIVKFSWPVPEIMLGYQTFDIKASYSISSVTFPDDRPLLRPGVYT